MASRSADRGKVVIGLSQGASYAPAMSRKDPKLCHNCYKRPKLAGKSRCAECLEVARLDRAARRDEAKDAGVCHACGQRLPKKVAGKKSHSRLNRPKLA